MLAPTPDRSLDEAERLMTEAGKALYRSYRETESPAEAMSNSLNTLRMLLDLLANERGYVRDVGDGGKPTDVEYVTPEEYARRPEPLWFRHAREALGQEVFDEAAREC